MHDAASMQKLPDGSPIIAVLVVSCNRITVERCLDQLIRLRPSKEQFPIVVSQDCEHRQTADVITRYGNQLLHIKVRCCNIFMSPLIICIVVTSLLIVSATGSVRY